MYLNSYIEKRYNEFIKLCRKHQVEKLYGFGSSVTKDFNIETSDIDLIVNIDVKDPIQKGEILLSFWDEMEHFFKRRVDLLTDKPVRNPYLQENILKTKQLIYDSKREKAFS